jgi:hypothetical protein
MSDKEKTFLTASLLGADTVASPTDNLFATAVEMPSADFSVAFETTVRSHQSFSAGSQFASSALVALNVKVPGR